MEGVIHEILNVDIWNSMKTRRCLFFVIGLSHVFSARLAQSLVTTQQRRNWQFHMLYPVSSAFDCCFHNDGTLRYFNLVGLCLALKSLNLFVPPTVEIKSIRGCRLKNLGVYAVLIELACGMLLSH